MGKRRGKKGEKDWKSARDSTRSQDPYAIPGLEIRETASRAAPFSFRVSARATTGTWCREIKFNGVSLDEHRSPSAYEHVFVNDLFRGTESSTGIFSLLSYRWFVSEKRLLIVERSFIFTFEVIQLSLLIQYLLFFIVGNNSWICFYPFFLTRLSSELVRIGYWDTN